MTAPTRPRRFDLIAFDWDGTLYDSTALIVRSIQDACRDVGAVVPNDVQASYVIGLGLVDALRHAAPALSPEQYPELGRRYRFHYLARHDELSLFAGTLAMLQMLRSSGHALAVATGKNRNGLDVALANAELVGMFDASRTADETFGKPHPRMLIELMEEMGTTPERTLMVGDTTHDLQMAVNAGTASVAVSFGAHPLEAFEAFAPLHIAHSTADLQNWLAENG